MSHAGGLPQTMVWASCRDCPPGEVPRHAHDRRVRKDDWIRFVLDVGRLCAIALDADPLWHDSVAHALIIALAMNAQEGDTDAKGP